MSESPRLLVFQHLEVEHPGVFRDFLAADGIPWDVIELDAGAAIPDLERYAGLWVMGGPMDVWQVSEYPWLALELAAIRRAVVELRMPFLGINSWPRLSVARWVRGARRLGSCRSN